MVIQEKIDKVVLINRISNLNHEVFTTDDIRRINFEIKKLLKRNILLGNV
jgi:hypothetical protein